MMKKIIFIAAAAMIVFSLYSQETFAAAWYAAPSASSSCNAQGFTGQVAACSGGGCPAGSSLKCTALGATACPDTGSVSNKACSTVSPPGFYTGQECCCNPKTTCNPGECGSVSNGCGGTLNCGNCPPSVNASASVSGTSITVTGSASDADCDLNGLKVYIDSVDIAGDGTSGSWCSRTFSGSRAYSAGSTHTYYASARETSGTWTQSSSGSVCIPESNAAFCTRYGKNCGSYTNDDNCGISRTVASCGTCSGTGVTCGGGGTPNVCGCTPDNAAACAGKNCGTATNNCGQAVSCGTCSSGFCSDPSGGNCIESKCADASDNVAADGPKQGYRYTDNSGWYPPLTSLDCSLPPGSTPRSGRNCGNYCNNNDCHVPRWQLQSTSIATPSPCAVRECQTPSSCNTANGECGYINVGAGTPCTGGRCDGAGVCDKYPPTTTIAWSPPNPNGNNGWYNTGVIGAITCDDVGSGCNRIRYTKDGGSNWLETVVNPYGLSLGDGADYNVKAYSFDNAGNPGGETPLYSIKVDTVPPSVTVTGAPGGWVASGGATASMPPGSCADALSGCDASSYRLKIYSSNPGACSADYSEYNIVPPQTISSHSWVCGTAKDLAGNPGFTALPMEFMVDGNPPNVKPYGIPFAPCDTDPNLQPDPDPAVRWIDCSATASLATSGSKGCSDAESGCNPASYKFRAYPDSEQPYVCPPSPSDYSPTPPQMGNATWICGYAEDNLGNAEVSNPTRFLVNRTFEITVNAHVYAVTSTPGVVDIPTGTEVKGYLCEPSEYFCNQDAKYMASGANVSDADRNFVVSLWYEPLIRGQDYKVGMVTDKGYSESVFRA